MQRRASLREALSAARQRLQIAGIEDAALEAEVLLCHAIPAAGEGWPDALNTGLTRAQLFAGLDEPVEGAGAQRYEALLRRRLDHEPTAYITGHRECFGHEFAVSPDVLIPRPETETLIEVALDLCAGRPRPRIVDVGTGSGVIAVCIALSLPEAQVFAVDTSAQALRIAASNAHRHGVADRISFASGSLLGPLEGKYDLIVANLPYVRSVDIAGLEPEVRDHEPLTALDGGSDGLDLMRELLEEAPAYLDPGASLCLEFGPGQEATLLSLAETRFPGSCPRVHNDLAGRPRVLSLTVAPPKRGP